MTSTRTRHFPLLVGLLSAVLFGAATPGSKPLLGAFSPQQLAGLLYLGAAVGVLPLIVRQGSLRWPGKAGRRTTLLLLGAVGFGGVLGPVFLLLGLRLASAGSVSLWLNLELVATIVLGRLIFREHMGSLAWIAAAGTVVAAVLLSLGEGAVGGKAAVLVALGCLCWGFDNHFTALIDGITPAETTFWKGIVAGAFNICLGLLLSSYAGSPLGVLAGLGVGALCYGLSIVLYI
ncbi:MAG: DMT family transporter, partial [Candidatus Eiseniibacteriota bacterium]